MTTTFSVNCRDCTAPVVDDAPARYCPEHSKAHADLDDGYNYDDLVAVPNSKLRGMTRVGLPAPRPKPRRRYMGLGFTLIELVVVIVILGILVAVGAFAYKAFVNSSRQTAVEHVATSVAKDVVADAAQRDVPITADNFTPGDIVALVADDIPADYTVGGDVDSGVTVTDQYDNIATIDFPDDGGTSYSVSSMSGAAFASMSAADLFASAGFTATWAGYDGQVNTCWPGPTQIDPKKTAFAPYTKATTPYGNAQGVAGKYEFELKVKETFEDGTSTTVAGSDSDQLGVTAGWPTTGNCLLNVGTDSWYNNRAYDGSAAGHHVVKTELWVQNLTNSTWEPLATLTAP